MNTRTHDRRAEVVSFRALPIDQREVRYEYGPLSLRDPDVPRGSVTVLDLTTSAVFPDTARRVWVHRPAGLDDDRETGLMVFNDGWWYLDPDGDMRGAVVMDNLAATGEVPPLTTVFVDPGVRIAGDGTRERNRNAEYDAFTDDYARLLIEEVLPAVSARFAISADPHVRGICGGSSGANAAMTAVWLRPDAFGRAILFNASFAQIPGGNPFPRLVGAQGRHSPRVFMHAAHRDLGWNDRDDNWFAENLETAAALTRAGHDLRLVVGDGGHDPNHGGVLLPDALRWTWRDGLREDHRGASARER